METLSGATTAEITLEKALMKTYAMRSSWWWRGSWEVRHHAQSE